MNTFYADLHCHIGGLSDGTIVKIAADRRFTLAQAIASAEQQGLDAIGIVDTHTTGVYRELQNALDSGMLSSLPSGGLCSASVTIILGTEIDVRVGSGSAHVVLLYRGLDEAATMQKFVADGGARIDLSTQRVQHSLSDVCAYALRQNHIIFPAHVFTPYRGLLSAVSSLEEAGITAADFSAVELGLSADADMADGISDLASLPWLANSDAHSSAAVGREYTEFMLHAPGFDCIYAALCGNRREKIVANYGLHPELGKYYGSVCASCGKLRDGRGGKCSCGSHRIVAGVSLRVEELNKKGGTATGLQRCYHHRVPLKYVPGIGKKTRDKLLSLGSEYEVLYGVDLGAIASAAGDRVARAVAAIRQGSYEISPGGGGRFGRVMLQEMALDFA